MEDLGFDFIVPDIVKPVRIRTGLNSLDLACGNTSEIGFPSGKITEIFGEPNVGKSSFAYFMSAKLAMADSRRTLPTKLPIEDKDRAKYPYIVLCDLEGLNYDYISRNFRRLGYKGSLYIVPQTQKNKLLSHSQMLDIAHDMFETGGNVLILDSVGAVVSDAELDSELADANMGTRARLVSKFLKRINYVRENTGGSIFLTNHMFTSLGTFQTRETAGGRTIRYLASIRLQLSRGDVWKSGDKVIATIIKGSVVKLRDGGEGRKFQFAIIPDYGISENLTAVVDCLTLYPKEFTISTSGTLRYQGDSLGNVRKYVEYELSGEYDKFEIFHTRLQSLEANHGNNTDEEND